MRVAICPGSFDPVTYGHLDIFERASKLFDKVIVLVIINDTKTPTFTIEERKAFIREVTKDIPNIEVDSYRGLLVDYMKKSGADVIVKGLRATSDFEYEFQMALINKSLYDGAETVFLSSDIKNMYVSSSLVRTVAKYNGSLNGLIPRSIRKEVIDRLYKGEEDA